MALFDVNELKAWRYKVGSCIFLINGEAISLDPMSISGIEIVNNYYENTFPIFKLNLLISEDVYYKIKQNKTTAKVKLRIQKYCKSYKDETKSSFVKDYINDTFVLVDDDNDVKKDRDVDLAEKIKNSKSDSELEMFDTPYELYLYREETNTGVKIQINNILNNVTMSSVIGYLFGVSGIKNALVSPLENNKVYNELLLPPITINKQLAHLDASYGFYKAGSLIFFGIDRTYVLNFKGGCTAFEKNEKKETCIYIPKSLSDESIGGGTLETDPNKYEINWRYSDVNFKSSSISSNVLSGSDALVVNSSSGSKNSSSGKVTTLGGKANTAIINNEGSNPWIDTTFTAQSSAKSTIVYGFMKDIDLSALTPNKKFTMIFEDAALTKKYKGVYLLTNETIKFVNDTARGDFMVIVNVEFRRVQNTTSTEHGLE